MYVGKIYKIIVFLIIIIHNLMIDNYISQPTTSAWADFCQKAHFTLCSYSAKGHFTRLTGSVIMISSWANFPGQFEFSYHCATHLNG